MIKEFTINRPKQKKIIVKVQIFGIKKFTPE